MKVVEEQVKDLEIEEPKVAAFPTKKKSVHEVVKSTQQDNISNTKRPALPLLNRARKMEKGDRDHDSTGDSESTSTEDSDDDDDEEEESTKVAYTPIKTKRLLCMLQPRIHSQLGLRQ